MPASPLLEGPPAMPWWRLPIVWMVIAGPSIVVVASFVTLALALIYPDPVVQGPVAGVKSAQPAMQARNHVTTPGR